MTLTSGQKAVIKANTEEHLKTFLAEPDELNRFYLLGYLHGVGVVLGDIGEWAMWKDIDAMWDRAKGV